MKSRDTPTQRRLDASRLLGVAFIGVLAQLLIDAPESFFGSADAITRAGAAYAVLTLAGATILAAARMRDIPWVLPGASVYFSLQVGVFVPLLADDPVIASTVILWNLLLLVRTIFPMRSARPRSAPDEEAGLEERLAWWFQSGGLAARHLALVALLGTIGVVGFSESHSALAQFLCLAVNLLAIAATVGMWRLYWEAGRRNIAILGLPLLGLAYYAVDPNLTLTLLALYQGVLFFLLVGRGPLASELVQHFFRRPALLVLATFAFLIALGTLLLSFPAASTIEGSLRPVDALFTAASATCVTGLTVLDTPYDFTLFGHLIILSLVQVGGLGIMVLGTFATLLVGGRVGVVGGHAMGELMSQGGPQGALRLTRFIVLASLAIETVGAALLAIGFRLEGMAWGEALWKGVFHAISAFCNAGFALQSDSLETFAHNPIIVLTCGVLIALGALGFFVMAALWVYLIGSARQGRRRRRLDPQSLIVLSAIGGLFAIGFLIYLLLEWGSALGGLDIPMKLANAFFMSFSFRTAGFNTVDMEALAPATNFITMVLMFIGGAPGSTAGGIKVTTFLVLLAAVPAISRGTPRVVLFGRSISQSAVYRSAAIAVIASFILLGVFFILLQIQEQAFEVLLFEAVSAVGTVGLSLGATKELSDAGRLLISVVMYVGRTGPLTIALLLLHSRERTIGYPETDVMVG